MGNNNKTINKEEMEEYKQRVLTILVDFDRFLRDNNIRYSLDGGTLLGAIRHKGYIPWDDDIDIILDRVEYHRLLKVIEHFNSEKYEVCLPLTTNNSSARVIKIYDKKTTIREFGNKVYEGAFIDVFTVLDHKFNNMKLKKIYFDLYRFLCWAYEFKIGRLDEKQLTRMKTKMEYLLSRIVSKEFLEVSIRKYYLYKNDKTDYITSSFGACTKRTKKMFSSFVEVEFEGYLFPISSMYDEYLKSTLGDYMKLPPEKERVSHHLEYLDLNIGYIESNNNVRSVSK